ncbi:MAG: hypothetical protein IPK23_07575 [Rhizobiales bacterium]|jgi:hypothetical protein|nr:hypothetical protein [Hyphomicrobiales bacterium]
MTEKGAGSGQSKPEEVAAYIAVLTAEMVRLARWHNLAALSYLLDLARMEAVERSEGD